jgi:hypothetical protein
MINLKFQYKPLFTIRLNHDYYPQDAANDLYLVPTPRTVKLLDKMKFLLRRKNTSTEILYDASSLELLRHKLLTGNAAESKLSFLLYSSNPCFVNITNIPADLKDKVFYCSNKNLGINKKGNLHPGEYIDQNDLYDIFPQELTDNEEGKNSYKVALESGETAEDMPVSKIQNGYQVDMASLLEGHYRIFGNDEELSSFINLGGKTKGSPVGYVDLFLNKKIKQNLIDEIEENEVEGFDYNINFDARQVFWKYIIVPNYIKKGASKLSINCQKGKDKIVFKNTGEEEVNDKKAVTFISEKAVKFSKFYEYEIQLKKQDSKGGGKVLKKSMPFAPFDIIKPMNEMDYMSEIYVYI